MKLFRQLQKMKELRMSTKDKQRTINVSEAFHLWSHLMQRHSVLHITETLEPFVKDGDFKIILKFGKRALNRDIKILEKEIAAYGVPLPLRPPKQTKVTEIADPFTDRYIYRRILRGIQGFLPTHTTAFMHSILQKLENFF